MADRIKTFFVEPIMVRRITLRRFTYGSTSKCTCPKWKDWGCDASAPSGIPDQPFEWRVADDGYKLYPAAPVVSHDDPHWPTVCESCGQPFAPDADWQVNQDQLYRRPDTGELFPRRGLPIGALWYAEGPHWGFAGVFKAGGPDGKVLCCNTPGGEWCIDSRCSNCSRRDDDMHRCWVRHGDALTGNVHVDKNGNTCSAGAGSIMTGGWHGFLHNGYLHT